MTCPNEYFFNYCPIGTIPLFPMEIHAKALGHEEEELKVGNNSGHLAFQFLGNSQKRSSKTGREGQ